ncbi:heme-degrading domain-containing protein [Thalassospira sp. GB04J01]|uniref:heme-degrading domain-containing protein n=1 Tax=Thalassospira sp. GB04J01 TaxID=1485225 RepID=UPI000C99830C|nr:heme-degrading domain-containing protein [Thalassospira sp. GB04J01]|tara:strand:+ start:39553 stop:40014 length:462 start_codon:yes stop_codon:yes gene_type:complete
MELDRLIKQEEALVFDRFDEDTAWAIGSKLVGVAQAQNAPVAINIRTPDRTLFHASLAGAKPANDGWARRKSNVTLREHESSMRFGVTLQTKGKTLADHGLGFAEYADHGGSFPIRVSGVGVIGAITVSGLASAEDHAMIVGVLADFLKVDVI